MLGISSLIIISCVSDGFSDVINSKLSGIDGHIRISSYLNDTMSTKNILEIDSIIHQASTAVKFTSPFIEKHAIIRMGSISQGVIIYGVPEEALDKIFQLNQFTNVKSQFHNKDDIIIGAKLAEFMNIIKDDDVILIDPESFVTDQLFKAKKMNVINTFKTDFPEYDRLLAFISIDTAREYFSFENHVSGLIVSVDTPEFIANIDMILSESLKMKPYITTTWKERHVNLLEWLNVYDVPIKLLMFFITIAGIFNIGASLWMIVIEKTRDLGILQALGLDKYHISIIILIEGAIIGLLGSLLAIMFSMILLILQDIYHYIKLPSDIYFMEYLSVKISPLYFIIYPFITFLITICFSYLPARKATRVSPSDALRYE